MSKPFIVTGSGTLRAHVGQKSDVAQSALGINQLCYLHCSLLLVSCSFALALSLLERSMGVRVSPNLSAVHSLRAPLLVAAQLRIEVIRNFYALYPI